MLVVVGTLQVVGREKHILIFLENLMCYVKTVYIFEINVKN